MSEQCDACRARIPDHPKYGQPTAVLRFNGCIVCQKCSKDMDERRVELNPAWVKLGPEADVKFVVYPDAFEIRGGGEVRVGYLPASKRPEFIPILYRRQVSGGMGSSDYRKE